MAVTQLASAEDVVAALGRDLTTDEEARVGAILDKASELFRRRSGQQFTPGESTNLLKVTAGFVNPTQRPVTEVTAVVRDCWDHEPVHFSLFENRVHVRHVRSGEMLRVTYTHGGEVPDLVRLTIAEIAKKVLAIDPSAATGVSQHSKTTGPFTEQDTYAAWAVGAQTMLSPDDAATADSFRPKTYGSIIQDAPTRQQNHWPLRVR